MSLEPRKPIKSLLVSSIYFPPQVGGISQYMASVVGSLSPEEVCCLTGACGRPERAYDEFRARIYRRPRVFAKAMVTQGLAMATSITEIMVRERPQVVQLATAYDGYLGLHLQRWLKLPFVIYAHGNEVLDVNNSSWMKPKLSLQRAARVLANSNFTAKLVAAAGVDPRHILVLHPGCNVELFRPDVDCSSVRQQLLPNRQPTRVILTVGNLVARKGHDMVLRALPQVLKDVPSTTYLIAGDGPKRTELEELAQQLEVRNHVVFAGQVGNEVLPQLYALADVFAMPCRAELQACDVEGFGLVFLEASACGKPVVGGNCGGVPDAVENGVTGWLVDPRDPDEIATRIAELLKNPAMAGTFGKQGRERVVREFTWDRFATRLREVLFSVVCRH
jgi:phosphatidylinositol alpha-1,6-mannosyltransferase